MEFLDKSIGKRAGFLRQVGVITLCQTKIWIDRVVNRICNLIEGLSSINWGEWSRELVKLTYSFFTNEGLCWYKRRIAFVKKLRDLELDFIKYVRYVYKNNINIIIYLNTLFYRIEDIHIFLIKYVIFFVLRGQSMVLFNVVRIVGLCATYSAHRPWDSNNKYSFFFKVNVCILIPIFFITSLCYHCWFSYKFFKITFLVSHFLLIFMLYFFYMFYYGESAWSLKSVLIWPCWYCIFIITLVVVNLLWFFFEFSWTVFTTVAWLRSN